MIAHTDPHNYHRPMKTIPTPHDALFKNFVTKPETAYYLLDIHLPPALRKICDLRILRLKPGSFIENDLRTYYSDVLYSPKMQGQDGYVYVLIESGMRIPVIFVITLQLMILINNGKG